jgi:Na+/melibiose symporter-like transporter
MKNDSKRQQDKSSTVSFVLFIAAQLLCCGLLPLLLIIGFSFGFGSSVWLIMGGVFIVLGMAIFLWCIRSAFGPANENVKKSSSVSKGN